MTVADRPPPRTVEELRYALAEADAETPDDGLRTRVLAAALAARPPGRPVHPPPEITPTEAFRRTVTALDALLAELAGPEWTRPALRDLDVQQLVGHLIGVEMVFQAALRQGPAATGAEEHIPSTQAAAVAQRGRASADTRRDWQASTRATLEQLAHLDDGVDRPVSMHGMTLPVGPMLVVRSFEMWIHEEDIRRATGRPLVAPDPGRLALMSQLAVTVLPAGMARVNRFHPGRAARLVLTGPAGGTWDANLGDGDAGPAEVRIVADAVAFCRLVADRLTPDQLGAIVTGDSSLGADVLAGCSALALD